GQGTCTAPGPGSGGFFAPGLPPQTRRRDATPGIPGKV
ncbi:MAG: hypothetical protein AVDCRST_MAG56-5016, partial [uncultured Cytophagales bacterium]